VATALKALVSALLAGGADGVEAPLATWSASAGATRAMVFVHPQGVMVDLGWVTVAVLLISALCICVQVARVLGHGHDRTWRRRPLKVSVLAGTECWSRRDNRAEDQCDQGYSESGHLQMVEE
jgi:hypothetical protein